MKHPISIVGALSLVALAACGEAEPLSPPAPPAAPPPTPEGATVVADLVAHMSPRTGKMTFSSLGGASGPGLKPQDLTDIPIVQNDIPGNGPANTVELVTNSVGVDGQCPAGYQTNTFCGNVTLRHFYNLMLSNVYVQVTAITDAFGTPLTGHSGINNDPSALGLGNSLGLWMHTSAGAPTPGVVDRSPNNAGTRDWVFQNPDNADTWVYLRVVASLYPTLWFNQGFMNSQSAPLTAGQPAILHFDYSRLPSCRGASWSMNGFFTGPNTHVHDINYAGQAGATNFDVHFMVPFGNDISFWFNNTDNNGCTTWDSNFGNNFHAAPLNPSPVIHFLKSGNNWSSSVEGTLKAGSPFTVDFDLNRLPSCGGINPYDRLSATTTATMFYQFDGGAVQQTSLVGLPYGVPGTINGQPGNLQIAPTVTAQAGAHDLAIWFQSADGACVNWDSNFGANYHFTLQ